MENKSKLNCVMVFCEKYDHEGRSLMNIFDKIERDNKGLISFDTVLMLNTIGNQQYIATATLSHMISNKGTRYEVDTFLIPPNSPTTVYKGSGKVNVSNGTHILRFEEEELEKGRYVVELFALPLDDSIKLNIDDEESVNSFLKGNNIRADENLVSTHTFEVL